MLTDIASVDDVIVDQADFNYGVEAFRTWFISVWVNYVTTFGVDGFRLASDLCILPINGVPLCSPHTVVAPTHAKRPNGTLF